MKALIATFHALLVSALLFAGSAFASETVNLNTADAASLSRVLSNVGPAKAQAIVEYREANGPFKSVEELARVRGIGLTTVERNIDRMTVGAAPQPARQRAAAAPARGPAPRR